MRRRVRKISGISIKGILLVVSLFLLIAVSGVAFYLFKNARDNAEDDYRNRIAELEEYIGANTKAVYRAKEYLPKGTPVTSDLFEKVEILSDSPIYADENDMGKILKADVSIGDELTRNLLTDKNPENEIREVDFDFLRIPIGMNEGDYADIRIRYPDGSDYIVVSKKKIRFLDPSRKVVSFYLVEEELLLLDSAYIDSLIYGGSVIYLTKYVSPSSDAASVVNYLPSARLEKLISDNPNILEKGALYPLSDKREILESLLDDYAVDGTGLFEKNPGKTEEDSGLGGGSIWD